MTGFKSEMMEGRAFKSKRSSCQFISVTGGSTSPLIVKRRRKFTSLRTGKDRELKDMLSTLYFRTSSCK